MIYLLLLLPLWAQANCVSVDETLKKIESCDDNKAFTQNSKQCLLDFQALVKKNGISLEKNLTKDVAASEAQQKEGFQVTGNSLAKTKNLVTQMIAEGKSRLASLEEYLGNLELPFSWPPDVDANDPELLAELAQSPCYNDAEKSILKDIASLGDMIKILELAQAETKADETTAGARKKSLAVEAPKVKAGTKEEAVKKAKGIRASEVSEKSKP